MRLLRSAVAAGAVCAAAFTTVTPGMAQAAAPAKSSKASTVASAQRILGKAEAELATARVLAKTARAQAEVGAIAPEILAQIDAATRPASFADQASEVRQIATLVDPKDPSAVLSQASLDSLSALDTEAMHVDPEPAPRAAVDPVEAAEKRVADAKQRTLAARALLKQINNLSDADGPGAARLAQLCADAGVVVDVCAPAPWSEAHLKFDTVLIGRYVNAHWEAVKDVGGWRAGDPYPDHPSGRAVDIMMPKGGSGKDVELGNAIARYFQKHAKEYGIEYMIWRQRQWKAGSPLGAWTGMSDRGSPTANHMDHVHITVRDGHSGDAFKRLLKEARAAAR